MRKIVLLTTLLVMGLIAQTLQAASLPALEIYGSAGLGGLISGDQKDIPDYMLLPTPDSYGLAMAMLGMRLYVIEPIGFEGFVAFSTVSAKAKGYDSLPLYQYTLFNGGLILRYNIGLGMGGALSLHAGGGACYAGLKIDKEFDDIAIAYSGGYPFKSTKDGLGWYGKAGLAFHIDRTWFLDLTALYFSTKPSFEPSPSLNGNLFVVAFGAGVALF